jgi:hypothetical protein
MVLAAAADRGQVSAGPQSTKRLSWRWLLLYLLLVAFTLSSLVAEVRGVVLVIQDGSFRNVVLYAALVVNTLLLMIGFHLARRIRPNLHARS